MRPRAIRRVAGLAVAGLALGGCSTVREYWQYYTGFDGSSLREPTGYYAHADAQGAPDYLTVPDDLAMPVKDPATAVPDLPAGSVQAPVGEDMDVRSPQVPRRSNLGLSSQWRDGEAVVRFAPGGAHGVTDEAAAWAVLDKMLRRMHVRAAQADPEIYQLTTEATDFNEFGQPYSIADYGAGAKRYVQIYRLRLGRGEDGELGVATALIGSMTMLAGGHVIKDLLSPLEQQRFAMGFSNQIIHELELLAHEGEARPRGGVMTLGTVNGRESLLVEAGFAETWQALRALADRYGWETLEYSAARGWLKVRVDDDEEYYRAAGVDYFAPGDGEFTLRLSVQGERTAVTIYDHEDKPLEPARVDRIFTGFAQAFAREYAQLAAAETPATD